MDLIESRPLTGARIETFYGAFQKNLTFSEIVLFEVVARISKKTTTGRRERQQRRRFEAAALFEAGKTRAEVKVEPCVSWRAAHTWWQQWQADGVKGLEAGNKPGPVPKFSDAQVEEFKARLAMGSMAHGYSNEFWTLRRVARLILDRFGLKAGPSEVWRLLRRIKWSPQKPQRKAREQDEGKINQWKTERWPELQAKADKEQRTMVFVDECGFSQKTTAKKTWVPSGWTPVLEMNFNRDKLSVIGGISLKSI